MDRRTPEGDWAALGARVIAQSECGDYGEASLTVWQLRDETVVIERVGKDGRAGRWRVDATDTLRVTADAWGTTSMAGVNTSLTLVTLEGEELEISHFEFIGSWGGPTDDAVAELARTIAIAASCTATVVPTKYPEVPGVPNDERVVSRPVSAPDVPPVAAAPPKAFVGDLPGAVVLGSLRCGNHGTEHLRAIRLSDRTVVIENATTGAHWPIAQDDLLVITPYAVGGRPLGVWTCLERVRLEREEQIAGCYCWDDDRKGADESAVAAFVATVAAAAACRVDHRPMVWD